MFRYKNFIKIITITWPDFIDLYIRPSELADKATFHLVKYKSCNLCLHRCKKVLWFTMFWLSQAKFSPILYSNDFKNISSLNQRIAFSRDNINPVL